MRQIGGRGGGGGGGGRGERGSAELSSFEVMKASFAKTRVCKVELSKKEVLEHMRFVKPDVCVRHWKAMEKKKQDLLYNVNRDNISDSLSDFVEHAGGLIAEMEDREALRPKRGLYFILKGRQVWFNLSFILCIVLNIWILVECSQEAMVTEARMEEENITMEGEDLLNELYFFKSDPNMTLTPYTCAGHQGIFVVNVLHTILSLLRVLFYLIYNTPKSMRHGMHAMARQQARQEQLLRHKRKGAETRQEIARREQQARKKNMKYAGSTNMNGGGGGGWVDNKASWRFEHQRKDENFDVTRISLVNQIPPSMMYFLATCYDMVISINTISYVGYFSLSVAALVMASVKPLMFSILLLIDIIQENRLLIYVLRSVYSSRGSLAQTGMLTLIFIHIFTVGAFTYLNNDFVYRGDQYTCKSLVTCLAYNMNFGLRFDGGIAESLKYIDFIFPRILYEDLYFLLINLTCVAIFSGIIIDTFGELRETKRFIERDMVGRCFICGIPASTFQRESDGFRRHVQHDHNMWQYLFLLQHLKIKDPVEYTAQESYVVRMLRRNALDFFPMGKAMALEGKKEGGREEDKKGGKKGE
mmetsp:Transcript_28060/g.71524  ORF Transcript_28060/g.71524 Transcript_28060/m.71524 type:complete len:586 (-) Transcript_28060:337-2094(-)